MIHIKDKTNKRIVIIDYGMGNVRSVQKKINNNGYSSTISSEKNEILKADKLILPGVGHFGQGIKNLKKLDILEIINEKVIDQKTPILGICLGMQIMANFSEEGEIGGLGWLNATIIKFKVSDNIQYKVPHIGWNSIVPQKTNEILNKIKRESLYYFIHSYHIKCNDKIDVLSKTTYDYEFTSAIQKNNIYGFQFHPEKSHEQGNLLINNFLNL